MSKEKIKTKKEIKNSILNDLNFDDGKLRITAMIDVKVYKSLKKEAAQKGLKYQTFLNLILNDYFNNKNNEKLADTITINDIRKIAREEAQKAILHKSKKKAA